MRYQIQASVVLVKSNGWRRASQVPTFFLDADVQGIASPEYAFAVALGVIDPLNKMTEIHATVYGEDGSYYAGHYEVG